MHCQLHLNVKLRKQFLLRKIKIAKNNVIWITCIVKPVFREAAEQKVAINVLSGGQLQTRTVTAITLTVNHLSNMYIILRNNIWTVQDLYGYM